MAFEVDVLYYSSVQLTMHGLAHYVIETVTNEITFRNVLLLLLIIH